MLFKRKIKNCIRQSQATSEPPDINNIVTLVCILISVLFYLTRVLKKKVLKQKNVRFFLITLIYLLVYSSSTLFSFIKAFRFVWQLPFRSDNTSPSKTLKIASSSL